MFFSIVWASSNQFVQLLLFEAGAKLSSEELSFKSSSSRCKSALLPAHIRPSLSFFTVRSRPRGLVGFLVCRLSHLPFFGGPGLVVGPPAVVPAMAWIWAPALPTLPWWKRMTPKPWHWMMSVLEQTWSYYSTSLLEFVYLQTSWCTLVGVSRGIPTSWMAHHIHTDVPIFHVFPWRAFSGNCDYCMFCSTHLVPTTKLILLFLVCSLAWA
jgi:hypothetical protein